MEGPKSIQQERTIKGRLGLATIPVDKVHLERTVNVQDMVRAHAFTLYSTQEKNLLNKPACNSSVNLGISIQYSLPPKSSLR